MNQKKLQFLNLPLGAGSKIGSIIDHVKMFNLRTEVNVFTAYKQQEKLYKAPILSEMGGVVFWLTADIVITFAF